MKYVYNATILRFRPYRDIGEFVNVGVLVFLPQINHLFFKMEKRQFRRITNFFPEVDREIMKASFRFIERQFQEETKKLGTDGENGVCVFNFISKETAEIFHRLTSVTEGILIFSDPISGLTDEFHDIGNRIFNQYVCRNFAKLGDTREIRLEKDFKMTLSHLKLHGDFKEGHLGNDEYRVRFPFVNPRLAIRTLSLQREPMEILECGDQWTARLTRLKKMNAIQFPILFPIDYPEGAGRAKRKNAIDEVNEKLQSFDFVKIMPYRQTNSVMNYIQSAL